MRLKKIVSIILGATWYILHQALKMLVTGLKLVCAAFYYNMQVLCRPKTQQKTVNLQKTYKIGLLVLD